MWLILCIAYLDGIVVVTFLVFLSFVVYNSLFTLRSPTPLIAHSLIHTTDFPSRNLSSYHIPSRTHKDRVE